MSSPIAGSQSNPSSNAWPPSSSDIVQLVSAGRSRLPAAPGNRFQVSRGSVDRRAAVAQAFQPASSSAPLQIPGNPEGRNDISHPAVHSMSPSSGELISRGRVIAFIIGLRSAGPFQHSKGRSSCPHSPSRHGISRPVQQSYRAGATRKSKLTTSPSSRLTRSRSRICGPVSSTSESQFRGPDQIQHARLFHSVEALFRSDHC